MTTIYNLSSQTVNADGVIALSTVTNQKGCNTVATVDGVKILKAGIYDVYATITGEVTAGGVINVAVTNNGTVIPFLVGEAYTIADQPATITLAGQVVVNSNCCAVTDNVPTTIQLVNNGTNTDILSLASLSVVKR